MKNLKYSVLVLGVSLLSNLAVAQPVKCQSDAKTEGTYCPTCGQEANLPKVEVPEADQRFLQMLERNKVAGVSVQRDVKTLDKSAAAAVAQKQKQVEVIDKQLAAIGQWLSKPAPKFNAILTEVAKADQSLMDPDLEVQLQHAKANIASRAKPLADEKAAYKKLTEDFRKTKSQDLVDKIQKSRIYVADLERAEARDRREVAYLEPRVKLAKSVKDGSNVDQAFAREYLAEAKQRLEGSRLFLKNWQGQIQASGPEVTPAVCGMSMAEAFAVRVVTEKGFVEATKDWSQFDKTQLAKYVKSALEKVRAYQGPFYVRETPSDKLPRVVTGQLDSSMREPTDREVNSTTCRHLGYLAKNVRHEVVCLPEGL